MNLILFLRSHCISPIMILILICFSSTNQYAQQYPTLEGHYCDSTIWGPPVGTDICEDTPTPTADLLQFWMLNFGDTSYVAWERCAYGAGSSAYSLLLNLDCDSPPNRDAMIIFEWKAVGSECPAQITDIYLITPNNMVSLGPAYQGSPDCINGVPNCDENNKFLEYKVNWRIVVDYLIEWGMIDPCNCDCNRIEMYNAVSLAGLSFNSAQKDDYEVFFGSHEFYINQCPIADFAIADNEFCLGSDAQFDASATIDSIPTIEALQYLWSFGDGTTGTGKIVNHMYTSKGDYIVKLVVTDIYGCVDSIEKPIKVIDSTPFSISGCPSDLSLNCTSDKNTQVQNWINAALISIRNNTIISDPTALVINHNWTSNANNILCGINNGVTVKFMIRGLCNAIDSCIAKVYFEDLVKPVITCPQNITIGCSASILTSNTGMASATDNCEIDTITFTDVRNAQSCGETINRTFRATDICGNTSTCTQIITKTDLTPPSFSCPPDVTIYTEANCAPDTAGLMALLPTATDECSLPLLSSVNDISGLTGCSGTGVILRTITAVNACNLRSSCTQRITIIDRTPPTITCPPDITVNKNDTCIADTSVIFTMMPVVLNSCGSSSIRYYNTNVNLNFCSGTGYFSRVFVATDACGNSATCSQTITVVDRKAPSIVCPPNITVQIANNCRLDTGLVYTGSPTGTDNCGAFRISYTNDFTGLSSCNNTGSFIRRFVVTDACNNSSTCNQIISIADNTKPVITCPANTTVYRSESCGIDTSLNQTGRATANDNCGLALITYRTINNLFLCNKTGSLTRIFTATDACGNTSSCQQTITVLDITPSSITCPPDITVYKNANCIADTSVAFTGRPTIIENCGSYKTSYDNNVSGLNQCSNTGVIVRRFIVIDDCNRSNVCYQRITVRDTIRPVITNFQNYYTSCERDFQTEFQNWLKNFTGASATDNCGQVTLSTWPLNPTINFNFQQGPTEVFIVATDACGNTSSVPVYFYISCLNLAKEVSKEIRPVAASSGINTNFDVALDFVIQNTGNVTINNVSLRDSIASQFCGAYVRIVSPVSIISTTASGIGAPNLNFNPDQNIQMLSGNWTLQAGQNIKVRIIVEVNAYVDISRCYPDDRILNTAKSNAVDIKGNPLDDLSEDGNDPTKDNDGDGSTDTPTPIPLLPAYGDFVWHDANVNGIQDFGEEGVPNVIVYLYNALTDQLVRSMTTDQDGKYLFKKLQPGEYYVKIGTPVDWRSTTANIGSDSKDSDIDHTNGLNTSESTNLELFEHDLTWDLGMWRCNMISGEVWYDVNKDGIYQDEENGLNGLTVYLISISTGNIIDQTITGPKPLTPSDDGFYKFQCVPPGSYYVRYQRPGDLAPSAAFQGTDKTKDSHVTHAFGPNTSERVTVLSGTMITDFHAGYQAKAVVGNFVWLDGNQNGIQEQNEAPVEGVIVKAINLSGVVISEDVTQQNGSYMLDGIPEGDYYISFKAQGQYAYTSSNIGSDLLDSDVTGSQGSGTTSVMRFREGDRITNVDAGLILGLLPLEWLSFTANYNGSFTELNWSTTNELNNDYFSIERKHESEKEFSEIGKESAAEHAQHLQNEYTFNDFTNQLDGSYYYRIKQIDKTGKFTYSYIAQINKNSTDKFIVNLFPNPVSNVLKVEVDVNQTGTVYSEIVNASGMVVRTQPIGSTIKQGKQIFTIDTKDLVDGSYVLKIKNAKTTVLTKFVVIK